MTAVDFNLENPVKCEDLESRHNQIILTVLKNT